MFIDQAKKRLDALDQESSQICSEEGGLEKMRTVVNAAIGLGSFLFVVVCVNKAIVYLMLNSLIKSVKPRVSLKITLLLVPTILFSYALQILRQSKDADCKEMEFQSSP